MEEVLTIPGRYVLLILCTYTNTHTHTHTHTKEAAGIVTHPLINDDVCFELDRFWTPIMTTVNWPTSYGPMPAHRQRKLRL